MECTMWNASYGDWEGSRCYSVLASLLWNKMGMLDLTVCKSWILHRQLTCDASQQVFPYFNLDSEGYSHTWLFSFSAWVLKKKINPISLIILFFPLDITAVGRCIFMVHRTSGFSTVPVKLREDRLPWLNGYGWVFVDTISDSYFGCFVISGFCSLFATRFI